MALSWDNGAMAITKDELSRFHEFAEEKLSNGGADSIEQLVDLWRLANPTAKQKAADMASIQRGIADAEAGRTVPADQAFDEARKAIIAKQ